MFLISIEPGQDHHGHASAIVYRPLVTGVIHASEADPPSPWVGLTYSVSQPLNG